MSRVSHDVAQVCRAFRTPPWVVGFCRRPHWPVRFWYWLRGYRP